MPKQNLHPTRSLRKKFLFSAIAFLLFFGGIESILRLVGVQSSANVKDPFVGFSNSSPLLVRDEHDPSMWRTSPAKEPWFNVQKFAVEKPANVKRVFCLGGSTTYGRPYDDKTSYSAWMRMILNHADENHDWEVINCGGISYASYRLARILDEIQAGSPDVVVIHTGHNEFLEHRTYPQFFQTPEIVRDGFGLFSHLRLATVAQQLFAARSQSVPAAELPEDVETILENTVGPTSYTRDLHLRQQVEKHFRFNLRRMVATLRERGVTTILVTPAANLKNCSPFKSEHRSDITPSEQTEWLSEFQQAVTDFQNSAVSNAQQHAQRAVEIDPLRADGHYLLGQIEHALGNTEVAAGHFERALNEDICPLRATTEIVQAVQEIADEFAVPLIDFRGLVSDDQRTIPGGDWFLDHVHPTIEGHRQLARALSQVIMDEAEIVPAKSWTDAEFERQSQTLLASISDRDRAIALMNLSKVLAWAGKTDEADELATKAIASLTDNAEAQYQAGGAQHRAGNLDQARQHFETAIKIAPNHPRAHYGLAVVLSDMGEIPTAIDAYKTAIAIDSELSPAHFNLGKLCSATGDIELARHHFTEAVRINSQDSEAFNMLGVLAAREGNLKVAEEWFRQGLQVGPSNPDVHANLAQVSQLNGQWLTAESHAKLALRLAPGHPQAEAVLKAVENRKR